MLLQVENIDTFYGKVQALRKVSIELDTGQIVSIIGANGAGKSTLINTIMGVVSLSAGSIRYKGEEIGDLYTHEIVARHITSVPEGRMIFPKLTVRENLEMGAYSRKLKPMQIEQQVSEVYELFPRLHERRKQMGGTLSGGEQQMLAIGRGIMNAPEILLLDEPSLGLAPLIIEEMFNIITRICRDLKVPVLLVEQNAYKAMEISDHTYVLENGVISLHGPSSELIHDPAVIKSYLGG